MWLNRMLLNYMYILKPKLSSVNRSFLYKAQANYRSSSYPRSQEIQD